MTLMVHDSRPNVKRLMWRKRIFKIGATSNIRSARSIPASRSTCHPPVIDNAGKISDTSHREKLLKRNTRSRYFMGSLYGTKECLLPQQRVVRYSESMRLITNSLYDFYRASGKW